MCDGTTCDEDEGVSGTITVDGEAFDATASVDTTAFTMEELGCVAIDSEDEE